MNGLKGEVIIKVKLVNFLELAFKFNSHLEVINCIERLQDIVSLILEIFQAIFDKFFRTFRNAGSMRKVNVMSVQNNLSP